MILPVILAGGVGERLWPLSRTSYPKQFLTLFGHSHSLFQQTILRTPENFLPPLIITHADYRFIAAEQLQQINKNYSAIILEPVGKNTAPAIAIAALYANTHYPNATLLVLPADHLIQDVAALQAAFVKADVLVANNSLLTFGIKITKPETGYGYIQADENNKILAFIEKPDLERATQLAVLPNHYWNSGMFMFKPNAILEELAIHANHLVEACKVSLTDFVKDLDFIRLKKEHYSKCEAISIDYAVMEKTTKAAVLPLSCNWNDIGNWQAIWELADKDLNGNSTSGHVLAHNSNNCLLSSNYRLIATSNVKDLIVIETSDAVLIANKDNAQDMRKLVSIVKDKAPNLITQHRKISRPWGWYDSLAIGPNFQVKEICVQVGKSLSLQSHKYRSEHWVIVAGRAKIVKDHQTFYLNANESTFIPQGSIHQLSNCGTTPLYMIEVQSGSYIDEDDIIRYADDHGRAVQHV